MVDDTVSDQVRRSLPQGEALLAAFETRVTVAVLASRRLRNGSLTGRFVIAVTDQRILVYDWLPIGRVSEQPFATFPRALRLGDAVRKARGRRDHFRLTLPGMAPLLVDRDALRAIELADG